MAASACAPMINAPADASVINVSMVKGDPLRRRCQAPRATGTRPTRVVSTNSRSPQTGANWLRTLLASASSASKISIRFCCQRELADGVSEGVASRKPAFFTACSTALCTSLSAFTTSFSLLNSTRASVTPFTWRTAVSMVRAQPGQSMPLTCQLKGQAPRRSLSSAVSASLPGLLLQSQQQPAVSAVTGVAA